MTDVTVMILFAVFCDIAGVVGLGRGVWVLAGCTGGDGGDGGYADCSGGGGVVGDGVDGYDGGYAGCTGGVGEYGG